MHGMHEGGIFQSKKGYFVTKFQQPRRSRAKFENMGSMDILRFLISIILLITLIKLTTADLCKSCQSTKGDCTFDSSGAFACRCNGIMHHFTCGQDN
nr:hypothetical protein CFP56_48471 [Quercus suber]